MATIRIRINQWSPVHCSILVHHRTTPPPLTVGTASTLGPEHWSQKKNGKAGWARPKHARGLCNRQVRRAKGRYNLARDTRSICNVQGTQQPRLGKR